VVDSGLRECLVTVSGRVRKADARAKQMYLQVFAKSLYFIKLTDPLPLTIEVKSVQKRLWLRYVRTVLPRHRF
jgi:hypothetical protein